jgi:ribosomal protein S4
MRRRKAARRRFRNAFYIKQQLRAFHGKIKEEKFRNFFKKYLTHGVNRNLSFFAALERRLDIFFFRMRLFPTIFACHQYILHNGVLLNKNK